MDKLTQMIVAQMGCEPDQVSPTTNWTQLHMAPAEVAILLATVADVFKVNPAIDDMATFITVGDLADWLIKKGIVL